MSGIDISSYCRRLAQLSEAKLALFYTVGLLPATFLGELATVQPGLEWLKVVAAVLGLCALSALVAVVTFYRDDEVPLAGVILGLITVFGTALAWALSNAAILRSFGVLIVFAAGALFALLVRLLFVAPAFAVLVWVLRKFRRWFAPDTLLDAD